MLPYQIEIQLIAVVVATACVLPGVFLVLRRMALMSDAISHAILLGIVVAFAVVKNYYSPLLIIGASLTGLMVVVLVEILKKTNLMKKDAAIGLVFPLLFSIGVILITKEFTNVHIDTDAVLLGELAFAPLDRIEFFGMDIGPRALYMMGTILLINIILLILFYKELKITTFDSGLAASIGFSPVIINYALMSSVSVTAVGAFDAVGAILVVALMIAPPATAYLITNRLSMMIILSVVIAIISAIGGYWVSHFLDVSIAGTMSTVSGILFLFSFLLAPDRGIISQMRRRKRQKIEFSRIMLLVHLLHHSEEENLEERKVGQIHKHLGWEENYTKNIISSAKKKNYIYTENGIILLTSMGKDLAEKSMTNI